MSDNEQRSPLKIRVNKLSYKSRNQNQLCNILPAPVPRTSHRIRTTSNNTESEEKPKRISLSRKASDVNSSSNGSNEINDSTKSDAASNLSNGFGTLGRVQGICSLANMGNTCFLNSVLYALRFLPGFSHDLHHLNAHMQTSNLLKSKDDMSSELGTSSLLQRIDFMSELHSLFVRLSAEELSSVDGKRIPAIHPSQFMESLRLVNPVFEGNQQQDAHELLHCILDQLCFLPQDLFKEEESRGMSVGGRPPRKRRKRNENIEKEEQKSLDVVGSKFVGHMCLQNRCAECEYTTSKNETFLEVCMPVKTKMDMDVSDDEDIPDTEVLLSALCKEESLAGENKYWCDLCLHHNEALRYIKYPQLPQHLLIHVKRFSSNTRAPAMKCCDSMPAPLRLSCFCQVCRLCEDIKSYSRDGRNLRKGNEVPLLNGFSSMEGENIDGEEHLPYSLTAFVCHLGATMSSGHYITYVRVNPSSSPSVCSSTSPDKKSNIKCSFANCCSAYIDRISPPRILNGHYGFNGRSGPVNEINTSREELNSKTAIWMECDDDKIKVKSFNEVISVLKSNLSTPYLLFYSR